jgi:hypothetical protein
VRHLYKEANGRALQGQSWINVSLRGGPRGSLAYAVREVQMIVAVIARNC